MIRKAGLAATCSASVFLLGSAVAVPQGPVTGAERAVSGSEGETLGFAMTEFLPAMTEKPNCPKGLNTTLEALTLAKATPEERARLTTPAGDRELRQKTYYFPDGELKGKLICHHPGAWKEATPPHLVVEGSGIAPGLDLDGKGSLSKPSGSSCAHQNFSDPSGRVNVDNQMYRIEGCTLGYRTGGVVRTSAMAELVNGSQSIVVRVMGVNDRRNDPDVQVFISRSNDPTPFTATNKGLPFGSLTVASDPKFQVRARGRIVDGVLTTEATDIILSTPTVTAKQEQIFRQARLQLTLKADGTAEGVLAGYRPIEDFWYNQYSQRGHGLVGLQANSVGYVCPSVYRAMHEIADGLRNPTTGKCEGISAALVLKAQPAFVFAP